MSSAARLVALTASIPLERQVRDPADHVIVSDGRGAAGDARGGDQAVELFESDPKLHPGQM